MCYDTNENGLGQGGTGKSVFMNVLEALTNTPSMIRKMNGSSLKKNDAKEDVKVFAKIPDWFKIPTPLGSCNPDRAILVKKDGKKRLYFVVETKGTDLFGELPPPQQTKIKRGRAHFAALSDAGIKFEAPVASYDHFVNLVNKELEK